MENCFVGKIKIDKFIIGSMSIFFCFFVLHIFYIFFVEYQIHRTSEQKRKKRYSLTKKHFTPNPFEIAISAVPLISLRATSHRTCVHSEQGCQRLKKGLFFNASGLYHPATDT